MNGLRWLLGNLEEIIGGAVFLVIVLAVSVAVVFRYVLDDPIPWTNELATIAFVWVVFIGSSSAVKRDMHIGVDAVTQLMPARARELLAIVVNLLIMWLLWSFIASGWAFSMEAYTAKVTPILRLPYTYVDLAVPVGGTFMMIRLIQSTVRRIRNLLAERPEAVPVSGE